MRKRRFVLLLLVTAGLAALAGFIGYRAFVTPQPMISPEPRPIVAIESQSATPARAIPDVLPDFALQSREGPSRALSSFKDRILIVNFWATWCAPCRREIPLLRSLRKTYRASGVEVVGIAVDFREDVLKYVDQIGLDYPLLIGEQDGLDAAKAFGMDMAFPFTVFADARRRIVAVKLGELHADEAEFILARIRELNDNGAEIGAIRVEIADKMRELAAKRAK